MAIETVNQVRALFSADMVFLVAYGFLLRGSVQARRAVPLAGWAARGALLLMAADATENIFALAVLRTLGDEASVAAHWWFVAMNIASALKWGVAAGVMFCLSVGWWRDVTPQTKWRRWAAWVIASAFGIGGVASIGVLVGLAVPTSDGVGLLALASTVALFAPAVGLLVQFRLLDTGSLMVRFLYLARVPFLVLLIMAAFGPFALGPAVDLLGGILVATNLTGVAVTSAAAVALLFACVTQINIVRAYSSQRVLDESLRVLDHEILGVCVFWSGVAAAASLLFAVGLASPGRFLLGWKIAGGLVLGTGGALAILFIVEWIAARLAYIPSGYVLPEFPLPFRRVPVLARALSSATQAPEPEWKKHFIGWFVSRLFGLSSGYVERLPNGSRRILPGHSYATVQFLLTMVVFWSALELKARPAASDFWAVSASNTDESVLVPTVTSVVLLLLLLGWALGAVAFFVDRYRTPIFTIALGMAFITGSRGCTDYRVRVTGGTGWYELATPGEVLRAFGPQPLVIATAGGGIQAGAWTARVLQGLDEHLPGTFRRRVAAISAVSGGSMGALYYGAYVQEPTLRQATQQALKSSLDDVATSLVSRDVFGVIGLRVGRDRGTALEQSWEQRLPETARGVATLRLWSERTRDFARGRQGDAFPAFLFNSTIVESGQPIAFATTQLPTRTYRGRFDLDARQYPAVESANRIFRLAAADDALAGDLGLKAVTAARLSAAFPYVSPAAALDLPNVEPFHLVDGGYYDVYGLVALSQWLDDALEEIATKSTPPSLVGVVIARGLASSDSALLKRLRDDDPTTPTLDKTIHPQGWRWQLTAPPLTALQARTFAQWAGGVQVLKLLIDKWSNRNVRIEPYVFDYPGADRTPACQGAPLSWKLTAPQQDCIEAAWKTYERNPSSTLFKVK